MNWLAYDLTRKLTDRVLKKAARSGMTEDDSGQVRQTTVYRWAFWLNSLIGLVFGGVCWYVHQPEIGLFVFLLSQAFAVPGLCVQYFCRLTYDEEGFTWRNVLGVSHRYSYEDVTGLYDSPLRVVVELKGGKRLDLDEAWINRQSFARAVKRYRRERPPKLAPPVLGMSNGEINASYESESGILARALLVRERDCKAFPRFKRVHYGLGVLSTLSMVWAVILFPTFANSTPPEGAVVLALPGLLCMAAALCLYFRYPQCYSAREIPNDANLSKEKRARHKRSVLAAPSLFCLPGGSLFFLTQVAGKTHFWTLLLAAGAAGLLFWGLLALFRRYAWEYRRFQVGYLSFGVWQVFFCLAVFFTLGGLSLS